MGLALDLADGGVSLAGEDEKWPNLAPVLSTKTINWDLISQQYDQIVKYTTALRLGTAEAEQVRPGRVATAREGVGRARERG
ncbi:Tn3 family transposase [Streptomyces sp. NPDC088182]|uniref:Tn3 family transposase n=1 Tax=Streptomyces sp. NPDC088182 TaxID=3365838 RepID=UPI003824AD4A